MKIHWKFLKRKFHSLFSTIFLMKYLKIAFVLSTMPPLLVSCRDVVSKAGTLPSRLSINLFLQRTRMRRRESRVVSERRVDLLLFYHHIGLVLWFPMDDVLKESCYIPPLSYLLSWRNMIHTRCRCLHIYEKPLDWGEKMEEQKKQTKFNDLPSHCVLIALTNA